MPRHLLFTSSRDGVTEADVEATLRSLFAPDKTLVSGGARGGAVPDPQPLPIAPRYPRRADDFHSPDGRTGAARPGRWPRPPVTWATSGSR
jgi:hypothetical protein